MLDTHIIDAIRREERQKREERDRPRLYLPVADYAEGAAPEEASEEVEDSHDPIVIPLIGPSAEDAA